MGRGKEGPRGFLPQNQLTVSQPDVVRGVGLSVIELKELQGACKFDRTEHSDRSQVLCDLDTCVALLPRELCLWHA